MKSAVFGLAALLSFPLQAMRPEPQKDYVLATELLSSAKASDSSTWRPVPAFGDPKILVIEVLTPDLHHSAAAGLEDRLRLVEQHFASVSHGILQPQMIYGGAVSVNPTWHETCETGTMFALAEQVDPQVPVDMTQYDARMYLLPEKGACWFGGLGTVEGNPSLPLTYRGLAPSQSWILLPESLLLMIHELGHNFGLSHASTPNAEYGDYSDVMGDADVGRFGLPEAQLEMRDFNAPHRRDLGWVTESIINRSGRYVISASEKEAPVHTIPLPNAEEWAYVISFRNGSLSTHALYGETGLRKEFVSGASVHHVARDGYANTMLLSVMADGEHLELNNGLPGNSYVRIVQQSHDADSVVVDVTFNTAENSEGMYAPGTCWDGIDNDGDGRLDFTGDGVYRGEGSLCAFPWRSLQSPKAVRPNTTYEVMCASTYGWQPHLGPMLISGGGAISPISVSGGNYIAQVTAPDTCGVDQVIRCGSTASGAVVLNPLETKVFVACPVPGLRPIMP